MQRSLGYLHYTVKRTEANCEFKAILGRMFFLDLQMIFDITRDGSINLEAVLKMYMNDRKNKNLGKLW